MSLRINIQFDKTLFWLLCAFAFFIPLASILEVFWSIDTVLKPYRIAALLAIGLFVVRWFFKRTPNPQWRADSFLYFLFGYGTMVTLYRLATTQFHTGYLFNDVFQLGIYLGIFVVMRHISISRQQLWKIVGWLVAGIACNAFYVFLKFFILQGYRREGGFMDNPNYLALSLIAGIIVLLVQRPHFKGFWRQVGWWVLLALFGYAFIVAGSRTGLGVMVVCLLLGMTMASMREKLALGTIAIVIAGGLAIGGMDVLADTGPLQLVNRIQKESSSDNRLPIWNGVMRAAQANNFIGMGVGQFKAHFPEYYTEENNDLIRRIVQRNYFLSPHSDYLAVFVVYGIIGLALYLAFLLASGRRMLLQFWQSGSEHAKRHLMFCMLLLTALVLFGITAESFNSALFWLLLALSTKTTGFVDSHPNTTQIQLPIP